MQWEYKIIDSKIKSKDFINSEPNIQSQETILNDLGRQGWELVSCTFPTLEHSGPKRFHAVLKRLR